MHLDVLLSDSDPITNNGHPFLPQYLAGTYGTNHNTAFPLSVCILHLEVKRITHNLGWDVMHCLNKCKQLLWKYKYAEYAVFWAHFFCLYKDIAKQTYPLGFQNPTSVQLALF